MVSCELFSDLMNFPDRARVSWGSREGHVSSDSHQAEGRHSETLGDTRRQTEADDDTSPTS